MAEKSVSFTSSGEKLCHHLRIKSFHASLKGSKFSTVKVLLSVKVFSLFRLISNEVTHEYGISENNTDKKKPVNHGYSISCLHFRVQLEPTTIIDFSSTIKKNMSNVCRNSNKSELALITISWYPDIVLV